MKNLLFPRKFKILGWFLFVPSILIGFMIIFLDFQFEFLNFKVFAIVSENLLDKKVYLSLIQNNLTDEIVSTFIILGALLISFSKLKVEDEYITKIRLEALVWATYANYLVLILAIVGIFGLPFLTVVVLNMFSLLLFFIFRFNYLIYQSKVSLKHEE